MRRILKIAATALAGGVALASLPAAAQDKPDAYTIGAMLQLTGTAAASGVFQQNGIAIALDEINADGGINGTPLAIVTEDQGCNPRIGVNAMNKLVHVDHVPASMIGCSGVSLAAAPIAERSDVLLLNAGAVSPALANASPYLLNSIPLANQQAKVMVDYAINTLNLKKFAVYYRNDDLGHDLNEFLEQEIPRQGGEYLGSASYDTTATHHAPQITRLKAMQPDAVFAATLGNETGTILKQSFELRFTPVWVGYSGFENSTTPRIGGEAAEGQFYTVNSSSDESGNMYPEAKHFYDEYQKRFDKSPSAVGYIALQYYEATHLLADAMRMVDSAKQPMTGDNIRKALLKLDGFKSVYGLTSFQENGEVLKPIMVKTIKDGKFEDVKLYTNEEVAGL